MREDVQVKLLGPILKNGYCAWMLARVDIARFCKLQGLTFGFTLSRVDILIDGSFPSVLIEEIAV